MSEQELERYLQLRRLVDVYYDIQEVRMRTENRLRQMPKDSKIYAGGIRTMEKTLTKSIQGALDGLPVYEEFFSRIHGIGPKISGYIIAKTMIRFAPTSAKDFKAALDFYDKPEELEEATPPLETRVSVRFSQNQLRLAQKSKDGYYLVPTLRGIGKFATISKYWAWWGLHVTEKGRSKRRVRGEDIDFDPDLRMFSWRIARSFKMLGKNRKTGAPYFYRRLYDRYKIRLFDNPRPVRVNGESRMSPPFKDIIKDPKICPHYTDQYCSKGPCKGHLDSMAMRYAVKMFLSHLWLKWRELEGLPVTDPYAIDKMDHKTIIEWEPDRE